MKLPNELSTTVGIKEIRILKNWIVNFCQKREKKINFEDKNQLLKNLQKK